MSSYWVSEVKPGMLKASLHRPTPVVSIGGFAAFKVIFTPLEYVLTIPPLSSYVINICFVLFI